MDVLQRMGPRVAPRTAVAPLELCALATTENAAMLRRRFRGWVGALTDTDTADDLALAVYEALANVVDHAYVGRGTPGLMTLWAVVSCPLLTGRDLVVTVLDEGAWRPSNGPGWRGRGLPLMRELMHSTAVLADEGGTTVQLRRRIAPASATSPVEAGRAAAMA
ncbi:ATP-binding protein [Actinomycetospora cinnamomea]|uniref:Anti-sigma regulatory factor (Ser/Thr protein kinase) n=1 Tax=Actinomycetospora cinnamomea TaxID=663609 RepID=A0A2U1FQU9_9PSEU|nr:ATP-binding protein [Actinomycetospora cinnamomea]PVZ14558.1 anti-sigma regulatory factor (Ser/Thr protein kinase) [Actinomycetospora cinnamomea]